jgi:hypothetical protein
MDCEIYKSRRAKELKSYLEEGFLEKQLLRPISKTMVNIGALISICKHKEPVEQWYVKILFIQKKIFDASDEELAGIEDHYLYKDIRSFLNKNEDVIKSMLRYYTTIPPDDKMPRYLEILSIIAKDCVELSLEEFKEDIKKAIEEKSYESMIDERIKQADNNKKTNETFTQRVKRERDDEEEMDDDNNSHAKRHCTDAKKVTWDARISGGEKDGKSYRAKFSKDKSK